MDTLNNEVLKGDPFYHNILNYLTPIDIFHTAITCKYYKQNINLNHIKKSTIQHINKRLEELFGDNYIVFKQLLSDMNGIIYADIIHDTMLNENLLGFASPVYDNNKEIIDYDPNIYYMNIYISPLDNKYTDDLRKLQSPLDKFLKNYTSTQYRSGFNYNNIYSGIHFYINIYYDDYFIDYMNNFDFCKNVYYFNGLADHIVIKNPISILTKQVNFDIYYHNSQSKIIRRYEDYVSRGFNFVNKDQLKYTDFIDQKHIFELQSIEEKDFITLYLSKLFGLETIKYFKLIKGNKKKILQKILNNDINENLEYHIFAYGKSDKVMIVGKEYYNPVCYDDYCVINFCHDKKIKHIHFDTYNKYVIVFNDFQIKESSENDDIYDENEKAMFSMYIRDIVQYIKYDKKNILINIISVLFWVYVMIYLLLIFMK